MEYKKKTLESVSVVEEKSQVYAKSKYSPSIWRAEKTEEKV